MRTKEQITDEIKSIFKKHGITPMAGIEEFWNAVEDVKKLSKEDGWKLFDLGIEWGNASFARSK